MLWDLIQQRQIGQAKRAAERAADRASDSMRRAETGLADLEETIDSLLLTCQAMWELLREQTNLSDEALLQKIQEVDLRDGRQDGRMSTDVVTCAKCSRPNNARHSQCMYCGGLLPPPQHVFG